MTKIDQMRKGTTTMVILKLLSQAAEPVHGYEIIRQLEASSQGYFRFKEGLVYPRLHQMEKSGFVESHWLGEPATRRRKVYEITEAGQEQLKADVGRWRDLSQTVNRLLGLGENAA
ncbi:MAG: PadR family transcriptional regulator [Anaerolineae bacterium]|nr:PadR family transcriptional regulator [Anaerolineae bacterium]